MIRRFAYDSVLREKAAAVLFGIVLQMGLAAVPAFAFKSAFAKPRVASTPVRFASEYEHSVAKLHVDEVVPVDEEQPAPAPTAVSAPAPAARPAVKPSIPVADGPLDLDALKQRLAEHGETLQNCHQDGGPEGPGVAEVTFKSDGRARVALTEPYANTPAGACIARRLASAGTTFDGAPVVLRVRFSL